MSLDGVKTTEYVYTPQGQGVRADKAAYTNSVMTEAAKNAENTSVEENKNTSKLDELKALCTDLGTTLDTLFHYPLENMSEEKLQDLIAAIKLAMKQASEKKLDKEKTVELARQYCIAVSIGSYTLKELEEKPDKLQGESISGRLETFFKGELKGQDFNSLSEAKKKEYIKRYFVDYFEELQRKNGNDIAKIQRLQIRDFTKLLVNSSDEEKVLFKQVITDYLMAGNKPKGILGTLASFKTQEARSKWADSWTTAERAQLGAADLTGKKAEADEVAAMQMALVREQTAEGAEASHESLNEEVSKILNKVQNKEELTEDEALLLETFKSLYAGEELGIPQNKVIKDEQFKLDLLKQINEDIKAHGEDIYNDVLKQTARILEENPELLTGSKEEIENCIKNVVGEDYTIASVQYQKEKEEAEAAASMKSDYGFTPKQPVDTTRLQELKQQFTIENNETFTVETESTNKTEKLTTSEIYALKNNAFRSASNITTYLKETGETKFAFAAEVFKNFSDMGSTTQDWAIGYFSNASTAVKNLFLNKISNSVSGMVAAAKEVDLNKFNLIGVSVTTQKQIDKIQEQKA